MQRNFADNAFTSEAVAGNEVAGNSVAGNAVAGKAPFIETHKYIIVTIVTHIFQFLKMDRIFPQ